MRSMYLKREAEQPLKDILAGAKVGVILGARQVGKTTLVKHVLAGQPALFLNFDVEVDKARFRAAAALSPTDAQHSLGSPPVLVIDEAQRLPEASRIVKGWHDARLPAKMLLLGSSSLDLLESEKLLSLTPAFFLLSDDFPKILANSASSSPASSASLSIGACSFSSCMSSYSPVLAR